MNKFAVSTKKHKVFVEHEIEGVGYVYAVRRNMFDTEYIYTIVFPKEFGQQTVIKEIKESELYEKRN
jgi:hypothetical protein